MVFSYELDTLRINVFLLKFQEWLGYSGWGFSVWWLGVRELNMKESRGNPYDDLPGLVGVFPEQQKDNLSIECAIKGLLVQRL